MIYYKKYFQKSQKYLIIHRNKKGDEIMEQELFHIHEVTNKNDHWSNSKIYLAFFDNKKIKKFNIFLKYVKKILKF